MPGLNSWKFNGAWHQWYVTIKRIAEMREFLDSQPTEVLEYDEQLVRRLLEKVTVYDERFEVEFKSGMTVDVYRK